MLSYFINRFGWKAAIAVVLAGALVLSFALQQFASAGTDVNRYGRADPEQFREGELDLQAKARAEAFDEFPLVWLGEEFQGYNLVEFLHKKGEGFDKVYLIYGECESPPELVEPSCVPPVSIVINRSGTVPPPEAMDTMVSGPETTRRGVTARMVSGGLVLWTGGVVITIHANSEHMDEATEALRTVNHQARGGPEVKPGGDLSELAGF